MKDYLKITLGCLMVSPLVAAFFSLDYSTPKAIGITTIVYLVILPIGFMMFNYLESGNIFKRKQNIKTIKDD